MAEPATAAQLHNPLGAVVDGAGNIFFTDTGNNEVREVLASSGNIVRIAGTGSAGYTGDGASALSATLKAPSDLALDGAGNLYIADTGNNAIRYISGYWHHYDDSWQWDRWLCRLIRWPRYCSPVVFTGGAVPHQQR